MDFYLKINNQDSFLLKGFSEDIQADGRHLSCSLDPQGDADKLSASIIQYYAENSISSIEVETSEKEILYTSTKYNKISTFSIHLTMESGDTDEAGMNYDLGLDAEI